MKTTHSFSTTTPAILYLSLISSYTFAAKPTNNILFDDFSNMRIGKEPLPNEYNPTMYRTVLDNTFADVATSEPKFNLLASPIFKRLHPVELANTTAVLKYEFVDSLDFNNNSYVNFYINSIKNPFNIKIDYYEHISALRDRSWTAPMIQCVTGQGEYSIPMNGIGLGKVDSMKISFIAEDPTYKGSLGLIEEIVFNDTQPVPEPLSVVTISGGLFALIKNRRKKYIYIK